MSKTKVERLEHLIAIDEFRQEINTQLKYQCTKLTNNPLKQTNWDSFYEITNTLYNNTLEFDRLKPIITERFINIEVLR